MLTRTAGLADAFAGVFVSDEATPTNAALTTDGGTGHESLAILVLAGSLARRSAVAVLLTQAAGIAWRHRQASSQLTSPCSPVSSQLYFSGLSLTAI